MFRDNHFGFARDMLEPLQDGRFIDLKETKQGLRQSPVFVRFIKDGKETAPANTYSQNLSTHATNSIVYKDDPASTLENPKLGQDRLTNPDRSLDEFLEID